MLSEKEYKEMTKNLAKIKELIKNNDDIGKLCKTIRTTPRIVDGNKDLLKEYTKEQKMQIREKLIEIATLCIDLTQLEVDFMKNIKKEDNKSIDKISVVIEGDYDEAMEQLENADLPEEIKDLVKSEIRKHFNK